MNAITSPDQSVPMTSRAAAPMPSELVERTQLAGHLEAALVEQVLPALTRIAASGLAESQIRASLHAEAEQYCHPPAGMFSDAERKTLIERAVADLLGYGPLESLWRDEAVSEILLNGSGEAYVERQGRLQWVTPPVPDEAGRQRLVARLCARAGMSPGEEPIFEARLPDGARLSVIRWPLSVQGTLVSLRRSGCRMISTPELIQSGGAAPEMLDFLTACVQARLNIVVSGPSGSGTTSLLGVLARGIPRDERVVTVEEACELRLQQPHWIALEARGASGGRPAATVRDLLLGALRMRLDRLVLGECRGPETADLLQAMAGGRDGTLTIVHANTPREALNRLESLVLRAEPQAADKLVRQDIASAVQIIVQLAAQRGGTRRIASISEITALEGDTIVMHELFRYEPPESRAAVGQFVCCGNPPHCAAKLAEAGVSLPAGAFDRRPLGARRGRS